MAFTRNQACTRPARRQGGFTLIEMSIAVAIFGLLASGAIMATSAWLGKQALDKTAKNLDKIESALTVYAIQLGRLPCPYDPNQNAPGVQVPGNCLPTADTSYVGVVPYRELGLQRTDVLDGWNRYITYAVDGETSDDNADGLGGKFRTGAGLTPLSILDPDSFIQVFDGNGESCTTGTTPPGQFACAAYVLVSHGETGRGAFMNFANPTAPRVADTANADAAAGERLNSPAAGEYAGARFAAEAQGTANERFEHILRFRTAAQILRDAY